MAGASCARSSTCVSGSRVDPPGDPRFRSRDEIPLFVPRSLPPAGRVSRDRTLRIALVLAAAAGVVWGTSALGGLSAFLALGLLPGLAAAAPLPPHTPVAPRHSAPRRLSSPLSS